MEVHPATEERKKERVTHPLCVQFRHALLHLFLGCIPSLQLMSRLMLQPQNLLPTNQRKVTCVNKQTHPISTTPPLQCNSDHLPHCSFLFPDLNVGKRSFSAFAAPNNWKEHYNDLKVYLPPQCILSKLHFHAKSSDILCSDENNLANPCFLIG